MDNVDFKDKYGPVALVTGASSGIGKAFADVLAAMGLDLVLVARRLDRLEKSAAKLSQEHGVQVRSVQIDLSAPTATQQMLDATGALEIGLVVSNAGFGMKGAHADNDPQAMAEMLMVNCHVPMQLAHGFIPRLRRRGRGGIIFTSSVEALMGCPYSAAYSASKALVKSLGEGLWAELQPDGIDVLTLCPGATESEAAANQGIDMSTLPEVMSAEEVARLTLENLANGPVFISSEYYRATFETLLAMPRRDALMAMAGQMRR
ncbi:SDR family NAD(P)-dependent oxidoreductase [Nocardia pseudovaccinii]|uniref:SDR family NAD(P)-dependent oxidoreductase n=1 Tax=Nocardia pseudovaccinii TaxID=189540 RepID=UPI0007A4FDCD|nr:SDR family NAD(P)-dependent oxidoreductase [Nocardia pseudovaccinii]